MTDAPYDKLGQLGKNTDLPSVPDEAILERVPNSCDGVFHEACTADISPCIVNETKPKWLRKGGYWYQRGCISIDVFYRYSKVPEGVWMLDLSVPSCRGRG